MSGGDGASFVVPKFGSFKSKDPQPNPKDRDESRKKESRDGRRKRTDDEDRQESRQRHSSDRRDSRESKRRRERARSRDRDTQLPEKKPAEEKAPSRTSQPELFVIDTKGDSLIRRYGTLDRSQVPAYYRHGHGRVLGTSGRLVIYRDGPNDQFSLRMPGEGLLRYRDRGGLRSKRPAAHSHPVTLRKRRAQMTGDDGEEGFLSLTSSRKRECNEDSSGDEGQEPSYRSIEGKAKPKYNDSDISDSDSDFSGAVDNVEESSPLKWKSIQLNRRVKEHPGDIDAWLELVSHQDALLRAGIAEGSDPDNEAHSYSEIKVSMLEKALKNAADDASRDRILVPLMREGAKVWSDKVAAKKWSELGTQADSHALWRVRLDFAMTSITQFSFLSVKKIFVDRLLHILTWPPDTQIFLEAIKVFLLATRFYHDVGHRERAVAAWQALFELTFFRPDGTSENISLPSSFNDFWESEVPRIGEAGAAGWKQYVLEEADGGAPEPPEPMQGSPRETPQSRDAYKAWSQAEIARSNAARLPARTLDDGMEEDDDPDRVVTFDDIAQLLFTIPQSLISSITTPLIDAFLVFCGLPPASSSEWASSLYKDQFLAPVGGTVPKAQVDESKPEINEDESIERRPPLFHRPYGGFTSTPDLLFPGMEWFKYLEPQTQASTVDSAWLEMMLGQLVGSAGIKDLAEYYLALSFARDPASIKKKAKALLKQSPDNAALYNAYGLAEHARGNSEVAAKVLESALSSSLISEQSNRLLLQYSSAWVPFTKGDLKLSKKLLCSAGRDAKADSLDSEVASADIIRANTLFHSRLSESLSVGDIESVEAAAYCLVLFSYLTNGEASEPMSLAQGNISAAMQTLGSTCSDLTIRGHGKSPSHERLAQCAAHLLYLHATRGPHRRAYIREQITTYLQTFPSNTILLSILEWSDAGIRVVDDTREQLRDATLLPEADCVGSRVFAIQHELGRGNVHTTKAAFEQAVRSDACKSSVALWVWYIRFAHAHRKQLRGKVAVDVFYRAVRHCPWAKPVFLEAFSTLAGEMSSDELLSVYSMMTSKGVRVHVELDAFLQRRREADKTKGRHL